MTVLPVCWAVSSSDQPQLMYILFPASLNSVCFNWMDRSAEHGECGGRTSLPSRQVCYLNLP